MTRQDHDAYPFRTRWEKIRALLDPTVAIPRHKLDSTDDHGTLIKRVWFSREWRNYDSGAAVWIKQYDKEGYDLRSFNTAERNILESLKRLRNCSQLVENYDRGSKLAPSDNRSQQPTSFISMTHMGPTVYDWLSWPLRVGVERKPLANLFELPGNFVRLALAGLQSLSEIHEHNLVHMDYRLPNVCLAPLGNPATSKDHDGDYLKIRLDWSALKAIDFGFSVARGKTPHTLLPLLTEATPAAQALIQEVEAAGQRRFDQFTPAERRRFNADQFYQIQHDHGFWTNHCPYALDRLRAIDWREDCYQFGRQLQQVRRQAGLAAFVEENRYLRGAGGLIFAIERLPEELIALGESVTTYPPLGSAEAEALERQRRDTYRQTIRELETALENMPAAWTTDEVLIFRRDIEPQTDTKPKPEPTATRPPRRPPWKGAAAIAGAALFLAYLPDLQEWIRPHHPEPLPIEAPQPTPEERAAAKAAAEAAAAAAAAKAKAAAAAKAAQAKAAALADWRKQAASIEQTAWWQRNAGKPTPAQLAWVRETQRLANEDAQLDPLIDLAALHCSGRAAPLIARNSAECGRQLSAVLQHANFAPAQQESLLKDILAILDAGVYNRQPAQADTAFATAILPGLQALSGQLAPFAFHASYIQGCVRQPVQLAAAGQQLETLLQRWPNSPAAREARHLEWPERLQRGDNLCVNP